MEEVQARMIEAAMISGDIIWRNKYTNPRSKIKICKTCVRPAMTYEIRAEAAINNRTLTKIDIKNEAL